MSLSKPKKVPSGYECAKFAFQLQEAFSIDVSADSETIHPTHFCHSCRGVLYNVERAKAQNKEYKQCRVKPYEWEEHSGLGCRVCESLSQATRGGRPKKTIKPGRPLKLSPRSAITHIRSIAPKPLADTTQLRTGQTEFLTDLTCPICLDIVSQPIELSTCSSLVCAECCCKWLRQIDDLSLPLLCPCCHSDHFKDFSTIRQVGELTMKLLKLLMVTCTLCGQSVKMERHHDHITSNCSPVSLSSPEGSIEAILTKSGDTPLSSLEEKLQTALVKRSLASSSTSTLQVKTGGQVRLILSGTRTHKGTHTHTHMHTHAHIN